MSRSLTADPDALLTTAEVAGIRRLTVNALAQERWRGDGPRFIRTSGRVLYRARDLAEWLAEHTVNPTPRSAAPQRD